MKLFKEEKNLALVSDTGTPGISDLGNKLIEIIVKLLNNQVKIVPISGVLVVTATASVSGFPLNKFLF